MINIFAFTSNRSDLIELQMKSFKKYIQGDFTFTILNNSQIDRPAEYDGINEMCKKWGVKVFDVRRIPSLEARCNATEKSCTVFNSQGSWSNPNCAGLYGCCYTWEFHILKETGKICLLHPDVFFNRPVNLSDYLQTTPLCFMPQSRPGLGGVHMHDALVLADMSRLPNPEQINWWGSRVNGINTDIGGQTFFYLQAHQELKPIFIEQRFVSDDPSVDFHPAEYEIISMDGNPIGVHYLRASNWNYRSQEYHRQKTKWLIEKLNLEGV
jgi:hypothetical protein